MLLFLLIGLCLLSGISPYVLRTPRMVVSAHALIATAIFCASFVIGTGAIFQGPMFEAGSAFYVDAFAGFVVIIIGFLQWSAALVGIPYLLDEYRDGLIDAARVRRYVMLSSVFVLSMLLSVVSNNLGFMWVALEATTLATTLLVAFYDFKGSLEAAWKYIVLCSTGISLGLIGLLFTYFAASSAGTSEGLASIDWTSLVASAGHLSPTLMKVAFAFILIGYGTKVGLVPMHAWLPDAHSRAPAPISAMLSGVLLNAALFSILRYKAIVDGALLSDSWSGGLLMVFGVISVVIPAGFMLVQTDYKRLLAYSSIEHMGLTAFLFGLGPMGAGAGAMHMVGHALSKSMLFFGAGNIVFAFKSTKFAKVGEAMRHVPYTGTLFIIGMLALLAVPPSPLFMSEYRLFAAAIFTHPIATALIAGALVLVAASFISHFIPLFFAPARHASDKHTPQEPESWNVSHLAMLMHIVVIVALGCAFWTYPGYQVIAHIAASAFGI